MPVTGTRELGSLIGGRYRLIEVLGEGGMATVYLAADREAGGAVAVKVIKNGGLHHSIVHTRFHREARAIAKLSHPGFAMLLDWGIDDDQPYMVMELVRGESLSAVLRRHARLATPIALRVAIGLCELLEHAHGRGLVHRDIKPGNIMMQGRDGGRIKLIDFGIAKHQGGVLATATMHATNPLALTREGVLLGSPPYTSPEQLRGLQIDHRTDIYSVGVLLYRMTTGQPPYRARTSLVTACMQLAQDPTPPSEVFPHLDHELEEVIMRCMSSEPGRRYNRATDLRAALVAILHRLASQPVPPTVPVQPSWSSRLLVATAAAFAIGATSAWLFMG